MSISIAAATKTPPGMNNCEQFVTTVFCGGAFCRPQELLVIRHFMNTCGDSTRVVHPLFQVEDGGSIPTSPLQLHFGEITLKQAKLLNELWHSRLPAYTQTQSIVCFGAEFMGIFYAAAIWSNPSSASLPSDWLELKRMAIAEDAPKNTASRMVGWMVREIRKKYPLCPKLISYQDTEVHAGTIYKAAGWYAAHTSKGDTWRGRKNRPRGIEQTTSPKVRWEFDL